MLLNLIKAWKKKKTKISLKTGIHPAGGRAKNGAASGVCTAANSIGEIWLYVVAGLASH